MLPSRRSALLACRAAVGEGGPLLLTGAAGVGKTWLARSLAAELPLAWVFVDTATAMTPSDLLRSIALGLGQAVGELSAGSARIVLAEALALASADGRQTGLILEEAHVASDEILEEVRLLSNRIGQPGGLAAIVISGQTPLARRFDSQKLSSLESRLAARVHLLPLDVDEASRLLSEVLPDRSIDPEQVESWHAETLGNPRRLIRSAGRRTAELHRAPSPIPIGQPLASETALDRPMPSTQRSPEPLVPAKPPLREEDGLIEVGWDADSDVEVGEESVGTVAVSAIRQTCFPGDEPIDDHYAALQAWEEWSRNQRRGVPAHHSAESIEPDESAEEFDLDDKPSELDALPDVWADGGQSFGPYGQLFSRLKPLREAE